MSVTDLDLTFIEKKRSTQDHRMNEYLLSPHIDVAPTKMFLLLANRDKMLHTVP